MINKIKKEKGILEKFSESRRSMLKSLGAVAAATPVVGSMFKAKDADAALADHTMYLRGIILKAVLARQFVLAYYFLTLPKVIVLHSLDGTLIRDGSVLRMLVD